MRKLLIISIAIPVLILLFFSTNIYGYFRFKQYCSNEGGLRVYEKLEKNVGWLADDYDAAHMAAQLKNVGFVRYKNEKDGVFYDLRYLGGDPQDDSSFEKLFSDESKQTKYVWKNISEPIENELRLRRFGEQILDSKSNSVLVYYYTLSYETTNPDHTLFGFPAKELCFYNPARSISKIDGWITELNKAFKN